MFRTSQVAFGHRIERAFLAHKKIRTFQFLGADYFYFQNAKNLFCFRYDLNT